MDRGIIERIFSLRDTQEADSLRKGDFPNARHRAEFLTRFKWPFFLPPINNGVSTQLIEAGYVTQQWSAGSMQLGELDKLGPGFGFSAGCYFSRGIDSGS